MSIMRKFLIETSISGLKEAILDALVEPKRKGKWVGTAHITRMSGIDDQMIEVEGMPTNKNFFTRALLGQLKADGRILGEKRGPLFKKKPTLLWQLTDAEFEKRQ